MLPTIRVNPWRTTTDLLSVRTQLYTPFPLPLPSTSASPDPTAPIRRALAIIAAWRLRCPLSHIIDSTALLREVQLLDSPTTPQLPLRLAYAQALSRFVTGLLDATQDGLYKKSMFDCARDVGLPKGLVILRHQCTHEALPTLNELRKGVEGAVAWLWGYYWAGIEEREKVMEGGKFLKELVLVVKAQMDVWRAGIERARAGRKRKRGPTGAWDTTEEETGRIKAVAKDTASILGLLCQNQPDALRVIVQEAFFGPEEEHRYNKEREASVLLVAALSRDQPLFPDVFCRYALGELASGARNRGSMVEWQAALANFLRDRLLDGSFKRAMRNNSLVHYVLGRCLGAQPNRPMLSLASQVMLKTPRLRARWRGPFEDWIGKDGWVSAAEEAAKKEGVWVEEGEGAEDEDEDDSDEDSDSEDEHNDDKPEAEPGEIQRGLLPVYLTRKALDRAVKKIWE